MKAHFKIGFLILMGVALLAITLSAINLVVANSSQYTPSPADHKSIKLKEVEELKEALQSKNVKPEDRPGIEAKIVLLEKEATSEAEFKDDDKNWSIKQTEIARETQSPAKENKQNNRPLGLIIDPPSTGVSHDEMFLTVWVKKVGSSYVKIFTGYENEDPNQGVILILHEEPFSITRIKVPGKTGRLMIEGSEGEFLNIKAINGKPFKFNINTYRLYYEETGEEVISETVSLTPTPASEHP